METIHLSKFTTKLQGLCHDGFSLYDVVVREEQKDGSFCDRKIKNVAIDTANKQAAFVLDGNSRIDELETENTRLKDCFTCSDCIKVQETIDQNNVIQLKEARDKLKKAKEIIKNLLLLENDKFGQTKLSWRCKVCEEAEIFIKNIEDQ